MMDPLGKIFKVDIMLKELKLFKELKEGVMVMYHHREYQ